MIKWWKERSTQERWMLALIVVLVIGIIVRWAWVSDEISNAVRERFS
jgi:flagellar biosynthesis/type III secretory pathway M-ring protein FliF/YscJ